ncbi:SEL1-like repeat protein [Curvivirga aplysinae]|uniref:SEL1-like repeat protein n=1 Tax=Curvivirga aplysinae TaxID=2529852 RepID=UPI001C3FF46D|nr:SEL1-like repeat protein [Curvivirga aplysinae]
MSRIVFCFFVVMGVMFFPKFATAFWGEDKACIELVAHPDDPATSIEGVEFEDINVAQAMYKCLDELQEDPSNPQLQYLVARVHWRLENLYEVKKYLTMSAAAGYEYARIALIIYYFEQEVSSIEGNLQLQRYIEEYYSTNPKFFSAVRRYADFLSSLYVSQNCDVAALKMREIFDLEKVKKEIDKGFDYITDEILMSHIPDHETSICHAEQAYIKKVLADIRSWYDKQQLSNNLNERFMSAYLRYEGVGGREEFSAAQTILLELAKDGYVQAMAVIARDSTDGELIANLFHGYSGEAGCLYSLWLINAAQTGNEQREAIAYVEDSAEEFCPDAMRLMISLSMNNLIKRKPYGFEAKRVSLERLERYASFEIAGAQYSLGLLYQHGDYVDKDIARARYWYSKAAPRYDKASSRLTTLP